MNKSEIETRLKAIEEELDSLLGGRLYIVTGFREIAVTEIPYLISLVRSLLAQVPDSTSE